MNYRDHLPGCDQRDFNQFNSRPDKWQWGNLCPRLFLHDAAVLKIAFCISFMVSFAENRWHESG